METKAVKRNFLILQSSLLLLMCTVLPDFGNMLQDAIFSASGILALSFDFTGFIAKLVGIAGAGYALYNFMNGGVKPLPVIILTAIGAVLALLSSFPFVPSWLDFITVVLFIIAIVLSKNSFGIEWASVAGHGFYLFLVAAVLRLSAGLNSNILSSIVAIVALIIYLMALGKAGSSSDMNVSGGISKLKTAIILAFIGVIIVFIPLIGWIVGPILAIIAFIFEYMAYGMFKKAEVLGEEGRTGAGKLQLSMILLIVGAIVGIIPLIGVIGSLINLFALVLVFYGWYKILLGIEEQPEVK